MRSIFVQRQEKRSVQDMRELEYRAATGREGFSMKTLFIPAITYS